MEKQVKKTKQKLKWYDYPLIALLFIICLPFIIISLPVLLILWISYLFTSPAEKKKFYNLRYDKFYPKYYWHITSSIHFNIYKKLRESKIPFEYEIYKDENNTDGIVVYIFKKDNKYNFVLCDESEGLHFNEEISEWELNDHQGYLDAYPFRILEIIGDRKYPDAKKEYYVCLYKKDVSYCEAKLSKEQKEMLDADRRFIELDDIVTLAELGSN